MVILLFKQLKVKMHPFRKRLRAHMGHTLGVLRVEQRRQRLVFFLMCTSAYLSPGLQSGFMKIKHLSVCCTGITVLL